MDYGWSKPGRMGRGRVALQEMISGVKSKLPFVKSVRKGREVYR